MTREQKIAYAMNDLEVEEHCQCGIDKSGKWSEELFEEFGCTCRDNFLLSIKGDSHAKD